MKPDSTISAIRPSMIALVSTTMCGSPTRRPLAGSLVRAPDEPDRLGGQEQVGALGHRQAEHPEPEQQRDPQRQPGPQRRVEVGERQPEEQAHQQPDQQADDGRHELGGRQVLDLAQEPARRDDGQVRQDREADHDPGEDPRRQEGAAVWHVAEQLAAFELDGGERETNEATESGPKDADVADQRSLVGSGRSRVARSAPADGQPSIAGTASPRAGGRSARAASIASRRVATWVTSSPSIGARVRAARRTRHDRPPEPEPSRLAQAAFETDDRAQLAEQPDLADRHGPRRDRPVARRGGQGEGDRKVERRLGDRQPAGQVRVDVVAAEGDPGPPAEDRDEQAEPVRIEAAGLARWRAVAGRADEGLDLDEQRPAALERRGDDAAGRGPSVIGEERARRICDLEQPGLGHLEDADLVGRAEAVLRRSHQAQGGVALTLEVHDGIDQVLEGLRARRSSRPWSRGRRG